MKTYYLLMIDNYKFIIHKQISNLSVTQDHEGSITDIVAIFTARDNSKYWTKIEDFKENIEEVVFTNYLFTQQGSYKTKINNFLNKG